MSRTVALSECAGRESTDPDAQLAAGRLLAMWTMAFSQAHRSFRQIPDRKKANAAFLTIVDKGPLGRVAEIAPELTSPLVKRELRSHARNRSDNRIRIQQDRQ